MSVCPGIILPGHALFGLHHILLPLHVCFSRQGLFVRVHLRQVGGYMMTNINAGLAIVAGLVSFFHRVVYRCIHLIYRI